MNKPCEHCEIAAKAKQGYFKCDNPCKQAKMCYESDKRMAEIFGDVIEKGEKEHGI